MNTFVTVLSLFACIGFSLALRCHVCSSLSGFGNLGDSSCNDPFDKTNNKTLTLCDEGSMCEKTVTEVGDAGTVSRSCTMSCTEVDASVFGISTLTKCCGTDGCNGAEYGHASKMMIAILCLYSMVHVCNL